MKILPIANFKPQRNTISNLKQNATPVFKNTQDTVSFSGRYIYLECKLENVNSQEFPNELYLNLDNLYKNLEKTKPNQRFERLRFILADLFAKRCDYLKITKNAKTGYTGFEKNKAVITVADKPRNKNPKNYDFDWTEQYEELENFFDEDYIYPFPSGTNMEDIKAGLPELLKHQGWIQKY